MMTIDNDLTSRRWMMAIIRWDPAREVDTLQDDLNRLFDNFFTSRSQARGTTQRWLPAMDLVESGNEYILRADLPGMERDDVQLELKDNVLTLSGRREAEHEEKHQGFYRVERAFGSFSRSLELPGGIDPGSLKAEFDRGVLEVRIPKPPQEQPRPIEIGEVGGS
jgi:HSP20 family protein